MVDKLLMLIGIFLIFALGFCTHGIYDDFNGKRILNGIYIYDSDNVSETKELAYSLDGKGDWVCINVAYNMPYELAYKTCTHECAHASFAEIYAEKCEDDPIKCIEILDE